MADIWVLTDSRAGNQKQALALADSVSETAKIKYEFKEVIPHASLRHLPNSLIPKSVFACDKSQLQTPYPKLIISCGRMSAHVSLALKQKHEKIKLVQILNPTARQKEYDLIILPEHDKRHYSNALFISGALTNLSPDILHNARQDFADNYGSLQKPILGVLIGGNNKSYSFDKASMDSIIAFIHAWLEQGYNIIGSFSRRTPFDLQQHLLSLQGVDFWHSESSKKNPYLGILAHADAFAVTCDSINMVSEAYHTGKPTYLIPLTQKQAGENKFSRFHNLQLQSGRVRHADNVLDFSWQPTFCDDIMRARDAVCALL